MSASQAVAVARGAVATGTPGSSRRPGRNMAIDALRGYCIVMMITGHVGTPTAVNQVIHFLRFVSGAEGFVFLAGLVVGMVYRRKAEKSGELTAYRQLWRRAAMLYAVHIGMVLVAVLANSALFNYPDVPSISRVGILPFLGLLLSLKVQPGHSLNILPLYVVLLATAPGIFALLRRGYTWLVLAASIVLFALTQAYPHLGGWVDPRCGSDAFPVPAWQGLFIPAMCLGYHYTAICRRFVAPYRRRLLVGLAVATTLLAVLVWVQLPRFEFYDHVRWDLFLWERHPLRFGRVLYFLVSIAAFYLIVQRGLSRGGWIGRGLEALALLGRNSLYCFLVHIVLAFPLASASVPADWWATSELITLGVVCLVYWMARYEVGRPWVPN